MKRILKVESYPNNEVRCVFYYAREVKEEAPPVNASDPDSDDPPPPLDIIQELKTGVEQDSPEESPASKAGYGAPGRETRFSAYGRRSLLRSGGALERVASDPSETLFLTGTLPGSTRDAKVAIASWSGYLVNGVKAWIAKRVPGKLDMYVWEFQKRGALHLHYAVHVPDKESSEYILSEWKRQWSRLIDAVCVKSGVDLWRKNANYSHNANKKVLQADAQRCVKSISRYLSKYISKAEQQRKNNHWKECYPSRLWGISRPLLAITRKMSNVVEVVFGNRMHHERAYEDCLSVMSSWAERSYTYDVDKVQARVIVGYASDKEETWLMNKIRGSITDGQSSSSPADSPMGALLIEMSRCLSVSSPLRSALLAEYGEKWLQQVGTGQYYNAPLRVSMKWMLSDYHYVVSRSGLTGLRCWPSQLELSARIFSLFREQWKQADRPVAQSRMDAVQESYRSESSIVQLNLFDKSDNLVPKAEIQGDRA